MGDYEVTGCGRWLFTGLALFVCLVLNWWFPGVIFLGIPLVLLGSIWAGAAGGKR